MSGECGRGMCGWGMCVRGVCRWGLQHCHIDMLVLVVPLYLSMYIYSYVSLTVQVIIDGHFE